MKFKVGDVVLFNNENGVMSKGIIRYNIREYGESFCTHAGIITEVNYDSVEIFEIVNISGADNYTYTFDYLNEKIENSQIIIRRPKKSLKNADIDAICSLYKNVSYGVLDIICILIYGYTGLEISLTNAKKVICSELVSRILKNANTSLDISIDLDKDFDLITPQDLYYWDKLKTVSK